MLRQVLAQQQVEDAEGDDSNDSVDNACAYLIDTEDGKPHRVQDIHQWWQHVAQLFVERTPIRAADQIAPVPANDVALLQQGLAEKSGGCLVVP